MATNQECEDVLEFQEKMGHLDPTNLEHLKPRYLTKRKLVERWALMMEELNTEFRAAINRNQVDELADALIDLVYFAKGTANLLGIPWKELWFDVHKCNMNKVPGDKGRGAKMDAIKPEGWEGPRTLEILIEHGFDPREKVYYDDRVHLKDSDNIRGLQR